MARTNIDIDDEACAEVMRRYQLATKREAVNFALQELAAEPLSIEEAKRMRGSGWDGDFDAIARHTGLKIDEQGHPSSGGRSRGASR